LIFENKAELPKNGIVKILDSTLVNVLYNIPLESTSFSVKNEVQKGVYNLMVTADGYKPYKQQINIVDTGQVNDIKIKMELVEVPKIDVVQIVNNLLFDFDKFYLRPESKSLLDKLFEILKTNPSIKLEFVGYTDSKGSSIYNQKLSKLRSKSAVDYLIKKGIDSNRLISNGLGEKNPIAINRNSNGTDCLEGRKYNRRVEVKLVDYNQGNIKIEDIVVPSQYLIKDNK